MREHVGRAENLGGLKWEMNVSVTHFAVLYLVIVSLILHYFIYAIMAVVSWYYYIAGC